MSVTIVVEEESWRPLHLQRRLRGAVYAALTEAGADGSLTLLLSNDEKLHALNKQFRAKDAPTNVLSFPAGADGYLGDIAIAIGVTRREAAESGKTFADHAIHLAVHGALHLAGFDHILPGEAEVMEKTETKILAGLGIADPYVLSLSANR